MATSCLSDFFSFGQHDGERHRRLVRLDNYALATVESKKFNHEASKWNRANGNMSAYSVPLRYKVSKASLPSGLAASFPPVKWCQGPVSQTPISDNKSCFPHIKYIEKISIDVNGFGKTEPICFNMFSSCRLSFAWPGVVQPAPPPKRFFPRSSPVIDFPYGDIDGMMSLIGDGSDEECLFVMFYAPWCGHSLAARSEFEKASKLLEDEVVYLS